MVKQQHWRLASLKIFILLSFLFSTVHISRSSAEQKILWVDSYQTGYEWSDGIERGIRAALTGKKVQLKIHHMDTKSCKTVECMHATAEKARKEILDFNPDVLIASDDNAQKFLVVPHLRDSSLPVVFCGVNWDASNYGYPTPTITGMVEVELVEETVKHMKRYARGDRIGYISGKTTSDERIISWLNKKFFNGKMISHQVADFHEFKKRFISMQNEIDMLFIRNYAGIKGWEPLEARRFIERNLKVPTGSNNDFMAPYVIFTLGKIPEEQGRYAAEAALKILEGTQPGEIPIAYNQQARLTVNLAMAEAANIILPISILKVARVIGKEEREYRRAGDQQRSDLLRGKKILWVDSYHQGYEWSEGLERGIKETIFDTGVTLKIARMNTKNEKQEEQIRKAAGRVRDVILRFGPDIVIASDDNAQRYLVVPYLMNTDLPVIFCGVNWDASMYGFPAPNVTGMIEVDKTNDMIDLLHNYSNGPRIGFMSGNVATDRKTVKIYNSRFFQGKMKAYLVSTQEELEEQYKKAQQEVDVLIFSNYSGISGWDAEATSRLVHKYTKIPTGSPHPFMEKFVVVTFAKSAEEQGRYAAAKALEVLAGKKISDIPLTSNEQVSISINLELAQKVGIVFPVSILKQAKIVKDSISE